MNTEQKASAYDAIFKALDLREELEAVARAEDPIRLTGRGSIAVALGLEFADAHAPVLDAAFLIERADERGKVKLEFLLAAGLIQKRPEANDE